MNQPLAKQFTIREDFPPADYDQWRVLAEEALKGASFEKKLVSRTYDGIEIQPLYGRDDADPTDAGGFPGLSPFQRGSRPLEPVLNGWDLRQEHAHPDLEATHAAIREDLAAGVTSVLLRFDQAARQGLDPTDQGAEALAGQGGLMIYGVDDLDRVLADVPLEQVPIAIDAGAASMPAAALLIALWQRREVPHDEVRGALNADPLAALAMEGQLPMPVADALAQLADLARYTADHLPQVTAVGVDTTAYHDAGATAAQDIGVALATGLAYLRAMTDHGLDIATAAGQITFRLGLGTHHFLAIAKLRAARKVWSRVVEACGGSSTAAAMRITARTAGRVLTQRDPYVNLLRNTVTVFAAGVAGADTITSVPLDARLGLPTRFSRRVARNTVLVLQHEAHLNRVLDPAGGSWYLDQLTDDVADKAWSFFQAVEQQGGLLSALKGGWIHEQIEAAYQPRAKDIARRKAGITGVSEFPNVNEAAVELPVPDLVALRDAAVERCKGRGLPEAVPWDTTAGLAAAAVAAANGGATLGPIAAAAGFRQQPSVHVTPLPFRNLAAPFEALRDASDAWLAEHGQRPRVFLANMGPVAHHTARATFSKNLFEAGGFEVVSNDGFDTPAEAAQAFGDSGANIAVICSSDKLYPEFVPEVASQLKAAAARQVVLAGFPGDNAESWQAAGVDRFIYMSCDVLAILRELLAAEGVIELDAGTTS